MTMLDYIREYTYLKIDFARSRALRASIEEEFGANRIVINNELLGVFRFFSMRWGGRLQMGAINVSSYIQYIRFWMDVHTLIKSAQQISSARHRFPFHDYASVKSLENL
jgi:hypothetical protein